jgi:subtilisin
LTRHQLQPHSDIKPNYKGGYDFVNYDSNPMDDNNHGTHMAAIRDGRGVVGVAPSANLYALKVLRSDGSGLYSDTVAALNWAVEHDMHVAWLSLGGTSSSTTLANAVKNAYDNGVLIVAAAGNDGKSSVLYPAAYSQVIAVGATDSSNKKASFSNYGSKVELVAPEVSIRSTVGSRQQWLFAIQRHINGDPTNMRGRRALVKRRRNHQRRRQVGPAEHRPRRWLV